MSKEIHHIKKQVLDFQFSTKSSASVWQKNFAFKYQDELKNTLTSVFDLYNEEDNCFQIDKIELDLGEISEEEMTLKVRTELSRELGKLLKILPESKKTKGKRFSDKSEKGRIWKEEKDDLIKEFSFFLEYGVLPWNSTVSSLVELEERLREMFPYVEISKNLRHDAALQKPWIKQRLFSQFSLEFSKGLLSTYFKPELDNLNKLGKSFSKVFERLKNEQSFPEKMEIPSPPHPDEIIRWLALNSPKNVNQWQGEFLRWIFKQQPETAELLEKNPAFREICNLNLSAKTEKGIEAHLYDIFRETGGATLTDDAKKEHKQPDGGGKAEEFLKSGKKAKPEQKEKTKEGTGISYKEAKNDVNEEEGRRLKTSKSNEISSDRNKGKEGENLEKESKPGSSKKKSMSDRNLASEEKYRKKTNPSEIQHPEPGYSKGEMESPSLRDWKEEPVEFSIIGSDEIVITDAGNQFPSLNELYVSFAGQVLIWPYLSHFFKKLEIINETTKFRSVEEQERAVLLLGYIATGDPQCEEHQLVVSKLLCGWPLHKPLVKKIVLRGDEIEEADVLLENLIGNWQKLQNTSIAGLRETFFWREGKLIKQDDNWKLLVEQKGVDILLDYLPYTISVIKIPWVKKAIMIDWA